MKTITDLIGRPVKVIRIIPEWESEFGFSDPITNPIVVFITVDIFLDSDKNWHLIGYLFTVIGTIRYAFCRHSFKTLSECETYCKSLNLPYTINYE